MRYSTICLVFTKETKTILRAFSVKNKQTKKNILTLAAKNTQICISGFFFLTLDNAKNIYRK